MVSVVVVVVSTTMNMVTRMPILSMSRDSDDDDDDDSVMKVLICGQLRHLHVLGGSDDKHGGRHRHGNRGG